MSQGSSACPASPVLLGDEGLEIAFSFVFAPYMGPDSTRALRLIMVVAVSTSSRTVAAHPPSVLETVSKRQRGCHARNLTRAGYVSLRSVRRRRPQLSQRSIR